MPSVALAKDGGGRLKCSETISYAQIGCTGCKVARTFDIFGKHLQKHKFQKQGTAFTSDEMALFYAVMKAVQRTVIADFLLR